MGFVTTNLQLSLVHCHPLPVLEDVPKDTFLLWDLFWAIVCLRSWWCYGLSSVGMTPQISWVSDFNPAKKVLLFSNLCMKRLQLRLNDLTKVTPSNGQVRIQTRVSLTPKPLVLLPLFCFSYLWVSAVAKVIIKLDERQNDFPEPL